MFQVRTSVFAQEGPEPEKNKGHVSQLSLLQSRRPTWAQSYVAAHRHLRKSAQKSQLLDTNHSTRRLDSGMTLTSRMARGCLSVHDSGQIVIRCYGKGQTSFSHLMSPLPRTRESKRDHLVRRCASRGLGARSSLESIS